MNGEVWHWKKAEPKKKGNKKRKKAKGKLEGGLIRLQ